jgi:heterodisulfide reductase subunit B
MAALDHKLADLPNWNCCGATGAEVMSDLLSVALPARNLAKAQALGDQIVTTCSACYLNLFRVNSRLAASARLQENLDTVLGAIGLHYTGALRVRHLLEVLVTDAGIKTIARPYAQFDGPDLPMSMDHLLTALGAAVVPYVLKTRCCGGVLMTTRKDIGVKLVGDLLAPIRDVDCVVTVCPLCQLNLEAYQREVAGTMGAPVRVPVIYFTQLIGLAFGLPEDGLKLSASLVGTDRLLRKLKQAGTWV